MLHPDHALGSGLKGLHPADAGRPAMMDRRGDPRRTFEGQGPGGDGGQGESAQAGQGSPRRRDVTAGLERGAAQPQETGDSQGDDGADHVPGAQQVERGDGHQSGLAHQVSPALPAPDAAGQDEQPQPAHCGQGPAACGTARGRNWRKTLR